MMSVTRRKNGDRLEYHLVGRFISGNHDKFREVLSDLGQPGTKEIVINLSKLEAIDSMAIGLILSAKAEAEKLGIKMSINASGSHVKQVLSAYHAEKYIEIQ